MWYRLVIVIILLGRWRFSGKSLIAKKKENVNLWLLKLLEYLKRSWGCFLLSFKPRVILKFHFDSVLL